MIAEDLPKPSIRENEREMPPLAHHFQSASSEMLGAILDQSVDCIKVIGPTGQLDYMNRNGRCALEIDDFALVAGRDWWDLWPEEARHLVKEAVVRASAGESYSFEAFCPTAKGSPRWWDVAVSPLRGENGELQGLISVSRDITDRVRATELREASAAEMRHRLQNAYTLAGAIVCATARGNPPLEDFASEIMQRLQRLGDAQAMLLNPAADGAPSLADLVSRLTEPFRSPGCNLSIGKLPDVTLNDQEARTLALVMGELCTNSNKYGALGRGGSILMEAAMSGSMLTIHWREQASSADSEDRRTGGTGHKLIQRALAACGGSMDIEWRDRGLDVTISLSVPNR